MREEILVTDTSMAVKMEVHSKVIRRAIDAWAEENLRAPKLGRSRGRVFVEPGDAYYIYIPSLQTYYFSKVYKHKLLIIIQNAAISAGIKVDYVNVPLGDRTPYTCTFEDYGFDMVVDDPESLYYYQNEIVEKASIPDAKQVVFEIQTGRGKVVRHDNPVRIPGGWKTHGELQVGDVVIGDDGKPTNVEAVYPHEDWDFYRITFEDDRSAIVGKEHLWKCCHRDRRGKVSWDVRDTETIEGLLKLPNEQVYIPLALPENTPDIYLPIEPYVLGSKHNGVTPLPEVYLSASVEQRWELIRGLMDKKGSRNRNGDYTYASLSLELVKFMQKIVWSLGGKARIKPARTIEGDGYVLYLDAPNPNNFFKNPTRRVNNSAPKEIMLKVKSIEYVGKSHGSCITVSNASHLYVLGDYIVTHNTKTSQKTVVNRKVRSAFVHRPAYVDKCKFDLIEDETGLRLKESEVWVCKGVESIYKLRDAGESGELDRLGIKAIIIPTVTMMLFIKQYINTAATVPMDMERFWDIIGVGCIINDEVHEHFLLVYLLALLTNPPFLLDMSATLKPGDSKKFIADRYLERFPVETRVTVKHVPIVDVVALYYQIHNMKLIQKVARMSMYNHGVFETELKRLGLQKDYFKMIYEVLEQSYLNRYQPGQKAVVYFSKVEFCEDFANYLRQRLHNHPNELFSHLVVYKFNAGDSYEDFVDADIGCSTPSKAGTAIDIPDLVTAIITVALDDKQLNEQITGRPRKIRKWPINPKVVLLHCSGIQKHINYLNSRFKNLKDKVLSFKIASSPYVIRRNK